MNNKVREDLYEERVKAELMGLLYDVSTLKESLPDNSVIRHHVQQFEGLCKLMFSRLPSMYEMVKWNLEEPTFNSLIVRILSGKWVFLRQAALQRSVHSSYLETLSTLDHFADDCYQRLLSAMRNICGLTDLSSSSPLAYLGPIARVFMFNEGAPCLISTPFGAANTGDEIGQELCRQTIPHEVSHAILEQISGLSDELRSKTALRLAKSDASAKQRCIHPTLLRWLDEIIADMAGTAVAGERFAQSACVIMIMPERTIGLTDDVHPIPLIRPFIHAWTLQKTHSDSASKFEAFLDGLTRDHIGQNFESLPAIVNVTLEEVRDELIRLVDLIWDTKLETFNNHSLGEVLSAAATASISSKAMQELPAWGRLGNSEDTFIFKMVGRSNPGSALPDSPLYVELLCRYLRADIFCNPNS